MRDVKNKVFRILITGITKILWVLRASKAKTVIAKK